ncbi:MAG TPA: alpha/beta fold hydrolase [Solirubrobacterales bacterium]|nr:alpha/beta fold hydrolase [Solirubrobacterales bacterium]
MATITQAEAEQVKRANESGKAPIVFVHGLWLVPSSWQSWIDLFAEAGYAPLAPGWPGDPDSVEAARANPQALAGVGVAAVVDHFAAVIEGLQRKPAVIGHSFGGLIAQSLAGRGLSFATVAVDPAPIKGVLPLPIPALRTALPALRNPLNKGRAITLSFEQFRYSWANAVPEEEARELYETHHVAAPAKPLFQAAMANLNPSAETKVETKSPERGPLLVFTGEADHAVPPAMSRAAYKIQSHNPGVTEHVEMPGRGHTLTIDHGWREVAEKALAFVKRFGD